MVLVDGGQLKFGGTHTFYGVLYWTETRTPAPTPPVPVIDFSGTSQMFGGLITDGNTVVNIGDSNNGATIDFDGAGFQAVQSIATAGRGPEHLARDHEVGVRCASASARLRSVRAPPMVLAVIAALLGGLVIGSFLNVVAWRLPRGESLAHPRVALPAVRHAGQALRQRPGALVAAAARALPGLRRADQPALPGRGG